MEVPDRDPEPSERGETLDAHAVGGGRLCPERGAADERERERETSLEGEEPVAWVTMVEAAMVVDRSRMRALC